ncbi:hypothetical protein M5E06_14325 [Azospirillum sp. A1-3]|uniref:hypothetical protein n=1 Tax=Azospirillum sp. A1-3 TaxID=185874 RepID=UPI0020773029|nr:hypothetical protein [Azospirillum sp. A1-3]MCM8735343.1 hypothetical protein [Azospirillum sp. A1-3]
MKREFVFNDKIHSLTILPARIERRVKNGGNDVIAEIDAFPGEQVVQKVIRRLCR